MLEITGGYMDPNAQPLVKAAVEKIRQGAAAGPFLPEWESLKTVQVPNWYEDGKFGIFIHWGLYCVPAFANEWYPRNMYQPTDPAYAFHRAVYGPQDRFGYKDFIPMFKAERFDPAGWADLFKRAGARFVVPVAEHHDGFAMYDCSFSRWTAAKMGPKRDIIGELASAVRAAGMVFGLSSHRVEHWWFMNGGKTFPSDVQDPAYADFYGPAQPLPGGHHDQDSQPRPSQAYLDDWLARTCELVDKYQPQLIWFDWWIEQNCMAPYLQTFASYFYNRGAQWQKGVAINYKHAAFPEGTAVLDIERGQLKGIRPMLWQNDTSVSKNSWGHISHHDYKQAGDIIQDLVDVVSKNGALLLNVGPTAEGIIPQPEQDILLGIGRWLAVNGEAIYNTRPWIRYGEGPTEIPEGQFTDTHRQSFTPADFRFTSHDDSIYAICLGWPGAGQTATIRSLARGLGGENVKSAELLGYGKLDWKCDDEGLKLRMPDQPPSEHAIVFKLAR
jgi:alpha-L-fucosidase